MKTLSKRIFAVVLTLAMTLTLTTWASAADFTDMPDNWAKAPLEAAVENGLLNGSDGLLRPTDYLTRAEMAAILVRAFGTTQSASVSGFSDVKADAWYVTQNAVPGAVFMEIMNGNNNGTFEPGRNISREQAFAVLARALKLEAGSSSVLAQFTDAAQISGWASGEVAAMVAAGYVNGSSGKLNPKGNITRQEFAQVMFNIFGDYISTARTVTELGGKAVMINVPGVTVKDTTVHGDVIIGEGVGEGDVFFENVTIEGRVVVRGGGVNSIHFINSDSSQVLVSKIAGPVRIVADKASSVAEVAVVGGTDTVTVQGSVAKVAVEGDAPVVVKDATVGTVEVSSTAKVELDNAKVTTVAVNTSNASVALTNGAAVATVDVAATAAGSTVTGEQGTTITTVKSDVSVTVAGDVKVNKTEGTGSVTDANGDVIATTPTSPSYPIGGGSTGGNKPTDPGTPGEKPVTPPTQPDIPTGSLTPDQSGKPEDTAPTEQEEQDKITEDHKQHNYVKNDSKSTAATCTTFGVNVLECTCGLSKTENVNKTNHEAADDPAKTVEATCATNGYKSYSCKNCNAADVKVETIDKSTVAHKPSSGWSYSEDKHWHQCTVCGNTENGNAAHSFTEKSNTATCEKDGKKTSLCECGKSKIEDVKAFNHSWTNDAQQDPKTETVKQTCSNAGCGKTQTIECPSKANHSSATAEKGCGTCGYTGAPVEECKHTNTKLVSVDDNQHKTVCEDCKEDVGQPENHTKVDGNVTKAATCCHTGTQAQSCTCGWTGTKVIPATGKDHTYKEGECDQKDPDAGTGGNTDTP